MKNKSFLSKVFNLSLDDDEYEFDFLEEEDAILRKSISKKIIKEDKLTNEEYIRLLEYVLSESKSQFNLYRNGKSYEMIFRETPIIHKDKDEKER